MNQAGPEIVVESYSLNQKARLLRIPEFVADIWDSQTPGSCVGVLQSDDVLRLSKDQGCIVSKLKGQTEKLSNDIVVGGGQRSLEEISEDMHLLGILDKSTTFLPNLMDPAYREYLTQQRETKEPEAEAATGPKLLSLEASLNLEQARTRGGSVPEAESGMFKYYKEDGVRVVQTSGSITDAQMEAASVALFRMFESAEGGVLSHRDIQQNIHLPPHHLRRLLEQLTEPQTERLGRKSVFKLKPQFRKA